MGNKSDLWKQLLDKAPKAFIKLSDLALPEKSNHFKVAVDLPILMHKYAFGLKCNGKPLHQAILGMANTMKNENLVPIFVEDGKFLKNKAEEVKRRKKNEGTWIKQVKKKVDDEEFDMQVVTETEVIESIDAPASETEDKKEKPKKEKKKVTETIVFEKFKPNKQDYDDTKVLLLENGFDFKTAKYEAEALCTWLCIQGQVDLVLTEDSDALTYLCPKILRHYKKETEKVVLMEVLLDELKLTGPQFQDLCIMLGNDFNSNISNHGFKHCLDYLQKSKEHSLQTYIQEIQKITNDMEESKIVFSSFCYEKNLV